MSNEANENSRSSHHDEVELWQALERSLNTMGRGCLIGSMHTFFVDSSGGEPTSQGELGAQMVQMLDSLFYTIAEAIAIYGSYKHMADKPDQTLRFVEPMVLLKGAHDAMGRIVREDYPEVEVRQLELFLDDD